MDKIPGRDKRKTLTEDEIVKIVHKTVFQFYHSNIKKEILKFIDKAGKELVLEKIREIDVPQVMINRLDNLLKDNFKPIIKESLKATDIKFAEAIDKRLKRIIDLKTSTISEIRSAVRDETTTEEDALKRIELDFPEYHQAIQ